VPTVRPSTDHGREVAREQRGTSQFSVCTHHPTVRLSLKTSTNARIPNQKSCHDLIWEVDQRQDLHGRTPARRNAEFIPRLRGPPVVTRNSFRVSLGATGRNVEFIPRLRVDRREINLALRQETKMSASGGSRTVGGHTLSLWESVPSATRRAGKRIGLFFGVQHFFYRGLHGLGPNYIPLLIGVE
jgi:hypothetical protein